MKIMQRKLGWIGLDVGTSTVKLAQVMRDRQGWRLAAAAIVPRQQNWPTNLTMASPATSSLSEIRSARSLQTGYRGERVAATLPMALCDLYRLDQSLENESGAPQILRQTIETAIQRSAADLQYDFWSAPATEKKPGWTQALALSQNWTAQLCRDISQAGWSCETIDGLPLALARAVAMVHPTTDSQPLAALDWGNGRATLCLIEQGQPVYVRCLKDAGFGYLLDCLVENLQVTTAEALQLLEEYGLASPTDTQDPTIASLIQKLIADSVNRLIEEIKRSFAHYQYLHRAAAPQSLYLLGGGALVGGIANHLQTQLSLSTQVWKLPIATESTGHTPRADCQLATAIALSALAWEAP